MKIMRLLLFIIVFDANACQRARHLSEESANNWKGFKTNFYKAIEGDDYNRLKRTLVYKYFPDTGMGSKEVFTFLSADVERSPLEYAVATAAHKSIIKLLCAVAGGDELRKAHQSSSLLASLLKEGLVALQKKTEDLSKEKAQEYKRSYVTFVVTTFLDHNVDIPSVGKNEAEALEKLGLQDIKERIEYASLFNELPDSNALTEITEIEEGTCSIL